ncbi:MAG: SulP family inorganic anion transporter [bacterium]|nr:SulP family inorganic anion transporter [bacterium]
MRGDIFGGLTAGVVALPLALAFGVASGAGPAAGLYGAIALGFFAAIFGGTPLQVSGPTGPMTVITASAIAVFPHHPEAVFAVILMAGFFEILLGVINAGQLIRFMPYPVISGFMSGIGIIIVLLQIEPFFGSPSASSPLMAVANAASAISAANPWSVLLATLTLLIVFLTPSRVSRVIPSPLIALISMTVLAWGFSLPVKTIGEMPSGLPSFKIPAFPLSDLRHIAMPAVTLALLGAIDSLLTSLVADSMTKERHNPKRELIGQGIGNIAAALIGGIPGAGATMRTVINIKSGGTTRFSGVVHALFLISVLFGLGSLTRHIPMAVLSGILIKVGIDILDYRFLKIIRKAPRYDLCIMLAVLSMTVLIDLIVAVAAGLVLAAIFVTWRLASQVEIQLADIVPDREILDREQALQDDTDYKIRTVHIRGAFFFGSATQLVDRIDRLLGTRVVVFNCLDVPFMDMSALFALEESIVKLNESGIASFIIMDEKKRGKLSSLGIDKTLGEARIFLDYNRAISAATDFIKEAG